MANGTAQHGADGRRSPDDDVAHVRIFLLVNVLEGTFLRPLTLFVGSSKMAGQLGMETHPQGTRNVCATVII
jgi:hypothetical protein